MKNPELQVETIHDAAVAAIAEFKGNVSADPLAADIFARHFVDLVKMERDLECLAKN